MKRQVPTSMTSAILLLSTCLAAAPTHCRAAPEKVIHAFTSPRTGYEPNGPLLRVGAKFYGTTGSGGTHGSGTIFSVDTKGHQVVLYNFKGNLNGGTDGIGPVGGLVDLNGILYGVTTLGGLKDGSGSEQGTIFSIKPDGAYKQIYQFKGHRTDGFFAVSGLVVLGNLLYGTTTAGGKNYGGVVFSITPEGSETVLYSFTGGPDGDYPTSLMTDGTTLYGTAALGAGTDCDFNGCGTIFQIDASGNETTLHTFGSGDKGGNALSPLLKIGNTLYGTTETGGAYNYGTVFSLPLDGGAYADLHDFDGFQAKDPNSLVDLGGTLYGTAEIGGRHMDGLIYSITTAGAFTRLYQFQGGTDGAYPQDLLAVNGTLYGTTRGLTKKCSRTEPPDCGTVFAFKP